MKAKKLGNSISINGEIDDNYQIPPGIRITLETGATFKGINVGGQVLYNNEYIVKIFSLNQSQELQLIPRELIQTEFLTHETEELEPLSPAIPTLHETLTPPPGKIDSAPEDWGLPITLHTSCSTQRTKQKFETSATVKTKKVEETPAIQTLEIFSEASKEGNNSADTIQLVGQESPAEATSIESHGCFCILL